MCLDNAQFNQPENSDIAYKLLFYNEFSQKYTTPVTVITVDITQPFVAVGRPKYEKDRYHLFGIPTPFVKNYHLQGGAIHCYRTLGHMAGELIRNGIYSKVFKVKGTGYIAHNNEHIAFKQIEFLEEIKEI